MLKRSGKFQILQKSCATSAHSEQEGNKLWQPQKTSGIIIDRVRQPQSVISCNTLLLYSVKSSKSQSVFDIRDNARCLHNRPIQSSHQAAHTGVETTLMKSLTSRESRQTTLRNMAIYCCLARDNFTPQSLA